VVRNMVEKGCFAEAEGGGERQDRQGRVLKVWLSALAEGRVEFSREKNRAHKAGSWAGA